MGSHAISDDLFIEVWGAFYYYRQTAFFFCDYSCIGDCFELLSYGIIDGPGIGAVDVVDAPFLDEVDSLLIIDRWGEELIYWGLNYG